MKSFKWCKIGATWEWVPFLYDSVIETIRSYVWFAGWEVQFIIVTSSRFVEAWYEKVMLNLVDRSAADTRSVCLFVAVGARWCASVQCVDAGRNTGTWRQRQLTCVHSLQPRRHVVRRHGNRRTCRCQGDRRGFWDVWAGLVRYRRRQRTANIQHRYSFRYELWCTVKFVSVNFHGDTLVQRVRVFSTFE